MSYCGFVSIYISLLDLSFPLFPFENLLFSYDMPYILVKCTCPKLYLYGLSCKTSWSWSSSSLALTWLYTLYNCVLASEMFRDAQRIRNCICNLPGLFVISCYALESLMKILEIFKQSELNTGKSILLLEVDILSQRLYYISYRCLWCAIHIYCLIINWHKAKLVSVTSSDGCKHQFLEARFVTT